MKLNDLQASKSFVQRIYSKGQVNPLNPRAVIFSISSRASDDDALVTLELHPMPGNVVHISFIGVLEDKMGEGWGNAVMQMLTKEADKADMKLTLSAVPIKIGEKKIPKSKLISFYKRHGFVKTGMEHMERDPQ